LKWIGISGSWRHSSPELVKDVTREVTTILKNGDGIVTGGALGVDYLATELALSYAKDGSRLKIYLPTSLEIYIRHYMSRAAEGVITTEQAGELKTQLDKANGAGCVHVEREAALVNQESYYMRDQDVVNASDELLAFQVNNSAGTQDTIDKARAKGIPCRVFAYQTS